MKKDKYISITTSTMQGLAEEASKKAKQGYKLSFCFTGKFNTVEGIMELEERQEKKQEKAHEDWR